MAAFHRQRRRKRRRTPGAPPEAAAAEVATVDASPDPADPEPGVPSPADFAAAHPHRGRGRRAPEAEFTDVSTAEIADLAVPAGDAPPPAPDRETERGLRGLVGSGSSQVDVWAAARARDAARPTDADYARAETELTIVRRNWVPREPFRPGGGRDRGKR